MQYTSAAPTRWGSLQSMYFILCYFTDLRPNWHNRPHHHSHHSGGRALVVLHISRSGRTPPSPSGRATSEPAIPLNNSSREAASDSESVSLKANMCTEKNPCRFDRWQGETRRGHADLKVCITEIAKAEFYYSVSKEKAQTLVSVTKGTWCINDYSHWLIYTKMPILATLQIV